MKYSAFIVLFASFVCIKLLGFESPNFILILTDDQGWTSLSEAIDPDFPEAKSNYHQTPNMNKLLAMGLSFTNAYAASPVCSPSRYSLQFGKSPARLKKTIVRGKSNVDHNQKGIPQILKSIDPDYLCAHFGKWHIDADPSMYGYDIHDGMTENGEGNFHNNDPFKQWSGYAEEDPKRVDSLTDRTIDFIYDTVDSGRPFFIQLSHYALHSDIVYSTESFAEMVIAEPGFVHRDTSFAAMIMDLDKAIGRLLEAYDDLGLSENTYLIFTSDNGGMPVMPLQVNYGIPHTMGLNSPLVRGKWDLMEGGIRVPFAFAGPGISKGKHSDTPVIAYDILPTLAELAYKSSSDFERFLPDEVDGGSLVRLLLEDPTLGVQRPTQALIFHFPHYNLCGLNEPHSAIRVGNFKLVNFHVSKRSLLFDLSEDISESNDLSLVKSGLSQSLKQQLTTYLESVEAEVPEASFSWEKPGRKGAVKTRFFERYP